MIKHAEELKDKGKKSFTNNKNRKYNNKSRNTKTMTNSQLTDLERMILQPKKNVAVKNWKTGIEVVFGNKRVCNK